MVVSPSRYQPTRTDPKSIRTTAAHNGNEWVINREKIFIANFILPSYIAVFFKDVVKNGNITNVIVKKDTKGDSSLKIIDKLGMHAMEVAEVILENVRVTIENTTGETYPFRPLSKKRL